MKLIFGPKNKYDTVFNWLVIASAGDPNTMEGGYKKIIPQKQDPKMTWLGTALHSLERW